ncbi:hypothetical protein ACHAPG_002855 [Botrytis cinerea]
MSDPSEMTDGPLDDSNSGIEQLVISILQQENNNPIPYTNEDETSSETDTQQVASTLKYFPENNTSTSLDTMLEKRLVRQLAINVHPTDISCGLGAPTPPVLFVNHESREEAEKYYKKLRLHLDA